ncbi:hypothetical protein ScPMuIL_008621 [Solemya velum]
MSSYKLRYFDGRGRAEMIRLCLAATGANYEDIRMNFEQWTKFKPSTIAGHMPILEVDGKQLAEADAIAKFVGREHGLAGEGNWEMAQIDMIFGICTDLRKELFETHFEKDEKVKAEKIEKLKKEVLPKFLDIFEKILESNGKGDRFLVGSSVTVADIVVFDVLDLAASKGLVDFKEHPKMDCFKKKVAELPRIAEYLKLRPNSNM